MTLMLHQGQVLDGATGRLDAADVLIERDDIAAVGARLAAPTGAQVIDASSFIVIPGLINTHTHAHNNLLRGLAGRWTLEDLLNHGPALNMNRTPEDHYLSATLGAMEMLKTGCTTAYDLFMAAPAPSVEDFEAVVRAYTDVGMRAVIAPAVADLTFHETVPGLLDLMPRELRQRVEAVTAAPAQRLLELTTATIRRWHGAAGGRLRVAVSPTIPTQCSEEFLAGSARLVREHGVGLHTHLLESKVQAIAANRRWGKTTVKKLSELGMLGPQFVGAHAVWLTDTDIAMLADAGAAVAHNPASNLRLGSGIAAVREMLDRGVTVGLGTDGSMSSDNQNLFEAMRLAGLLGNVRFPHDRDRWLEAEDVWRVATVGGARALGLADQVGAVAPGRKADLVLLRADSTFLRPMGAALGSLVYAETGAAVDTVIVGGRVVVRDGRVLTVDESRLRARAQAAADSLCGRNTAAWQLAAEIGPYLSQACRTAVAASYPVNRYAAPVGG
jgi:5-methylthioadenosine/S-adenosylhomocysteine deaminase